MRISRFVFALAGAITACSADGGPSPDAADTPPFDPLQDIGDVELVEETFAFTEGPLWRATEGVLLFSDIERNCIHRLTPPSTIDVFRADSNNANGLQTDVSGLLLAAEHGTRRVSRTLADETIEPVADVYEGLPLNSPNDIAARSDGMVYFTDPPYGIDPADQALTFNGVFRVDPSGTLTAEWEGPLASRPNGVALSPDESILYVVDTEGDLMAFDVATDGSLSNERVFAADVPSGDGLAVDTGGNVFVAAADGVRAYSPDGVLWGTIAVPRQPTNCGFGEADARTLYVTARQGLYRVRLGRPGVW